MSNRNITSAAKYLRKEIERVLLTSQFASERFPCSLLAIDSFEPKTAEV